MNQEQLEQSIKAVYGSDVDANTYLQKFVDITATLPRGDTSHFSSIKEYIKFLLMASSYLKSWLT